jgi:hypothetical protein
MFAQCSKSCLGCTSDPVCSDNYDYSGLCPGWAFNGFCSRNPLFMFNNCWKSCTNCTAAQICANVQDDALCEAWARNGECSGNPVFMYANCRVACTKCAPYNNGVPNCVNALLNDSVCDALATNLTCVSNPSFMFQFCYKSCTGCYQAAQVGTNPVPSNQILQATAGYDVILPYYFSNNATLTQVTTFFATNNTLLFQIWRWNGTTFNLVYYLPITPPGPNITLVTPVLTCVYVLAGDSIGIASLNGPIPVAFTILPNAFYNFFVKPATSSGTFTSSLLPVAFSIDVQFQNNFTCQ